MRCVVLGVDIGGSHIKAAPVDTTDGELVTPRERVPTPRPGTPDQVIAAIGELSDRFSWSGSSGVTFPGVVEHGVVRTAAHLDQSWIGVDLAHLVAHAFGQPTTAINDADAAGLAEMTFGAGFGHDGVVVTITLGTGVGTGVFVDGILVPNTELGHLTVHGRDMETRVAARARTDDRESWKKWGHDVNAYLQVLEGLLWPSLFVIGGGVSADFSQFAKYLHTRTPVLAARTGNDAGIIGAALTQARVARTAA